VYFLIDILGPFLALVLLFKIKRVGWEHTLYLSFIKR
jgi:hypothetical protein